MSASPTPTQNKSWLSIKPQQTSTQSTPSPLTNKIQLQQTNGQQQQQSPNQPTQQSTTPSPPKIQLHTSPNTASQQTSGQQQHLPNQPLQQIPK